MTGATGATPADLAANDEKGTLELSFPTPPLIKYADSHFCLHEEPSRLHKLLPRQGAHPSLDAKTRLAQFIRADPLFSRQELQRGGCAEAAVRKQH